MVHDQRVDVQLGHLGHVGQQLRHGHQRGHHALHVGRRHVAVALQQARHAGALDQRVRQRRIQRRQRHGAVLHHLHRRAALAEQDDGAEGGVDAGADDQLLRLRFLHHALHGEALQPRLGKLLAHARQHQLDGGAHLVLALQVQHHAAHVGLVRDVFGQDLQHHRKADARRLGRCGVGIGRHGAGGHHGDVVGLAHGLGLGLGQHVAAGGQYALDQRAHARHVGRAAVVQLGGGRGLGQLGLVAGVALQRADGGHGLLGQVVAGDAGVDEQLARLGHGRAAHPGADQRQRALARRLDGRQHGARDVGGGHDGRGRVDEQQRAGVLRVLGQRVQRIHIALRRRVADDVDRVAARPVGGQHLVEVADEAVAQLGQRHAVRGGGIGRHHAHAAAVGQDGHLVADGRLEARQDLGRQEQLFQAVHAQHAGAGDGGVDHVVGAGQRAGVRGGGLLALLAAASLDHDHRLVARRRACGRHELARLVHRFDVQQDGARVGVVGQVVEHVAEVDVGMLAQRHEVREADLPRLGPVEHGGDQRARLRHEGQFARPRRNVREAGVEPGVRRQQAHAVGAQNAHQRGPGGVQHGLLLLRRQAGADDHHRLGAAPRQLFDQVHHRAGRRADHGQFGRLGQVGHAGVAALARQRLVLWVDREHGAGKAAGAHVVPQRAADGEGPLGRADDGHGLRVEQGIEIADAHGLPQGGVAPVPPA